MPQRPSLIPAVYYQDPRAAIAWLQNAFGFELVMLIEDPDGNVVHAEMNYGTGVVMVGGEWSEHHKSPRSVGGKTTQSIHVEVGGDIHTHFERAQGQGAEILEPPTKQFYGAISYRARDPEGHFWTVAQQAEAVTREEAEAASGLKITGWV